MTFLRVLLIGNGGREHAIACKLSQSEFVDQIIVVPGNGGTARLRKSKNESSVAPDDYAGLVQLARRERVNLVVPGPEAPLVDGIEGHFREAGIPCFGPSKEAARIEGSKTFAKDFMKRHGIPTAAYENFSDYETASSYLATVKHGVVIKASGLAAGKGVMMPQTQQEAQEALRRLMLDRQFGSAGDEVVIEELLTGDELSILSFSDGTTIKSLPAAQDHKRIGEGDTGLNTGGMGCYAPAGIATPELLEQVQREILKPTIDGMRLDGFPFKGCLFTGLMITPKGPKVLEYNVRFGDPETQTLLPLLESDLAAIMVACTHSFFPLLRSTEVEVSRRSSATVVVAAPGYPDSYPKKIPVRLGTAPEGITLYHAGTELVQDRLRTTGGRVMAATATGDRLQHALDKAYEGVGLIDFEGMYYRKDIGHRAFGDGDKVSSKLTYAQAGVSIDAGNALVQRIKACVAKTRVAGAHADIGGFGGEFDMDAAGLHDATVLVGAMDGVGTKLLVAQAMDKHDTVGIDLVAMNVNDLVCQGATPVMFLDYYACGTLEPSVAAEFVEGVAQGCLLAGCALVGGETAEMPGLHPIGEYDVAGAAFGVMRPGDRLPCPTIMRAGDVLLGLASSGLHSNGFSLVRAILSRHKLRYTDPAPWDPSTSVGLSLLTPTRIYVKAVIAVRDRLLAAAHITGGGLVDNLPRVLPSHLSADVDVTAWPRPPVLKWLAGEADRADVPRTFNNGVGMVLVVRERDVKSVKEDLERMGERVFWIGGLVPREGGEACVLRGLGAWE